MHITAVIFLFMQFYCICENWHVYKEFENEELIKSKSYVIIKTFNM